MSKDIYVRIGQRKEAKTFFRCAIGFTKKWQKVEGVDEATFNRLKAEQMLEVSEEKPADFEEGSPNAADPAGDSTGGGSGTSATVPTDPAERQAAIKDAVAKLDKADAALWMKNGQPKTEAIAAITGWPVTAAERNEAAPAAAE